MSQLNVADHLLVVGLCSIFLGCGGEAAVETDGVFDPYTGVRKVSDPRDFAEVDLGEFNLMIPQAKGGKTMSVSFHAFAVVPKDQQDEFLELVEKHKDRLRSRVTALVRETSVADLLDPRLMLFRSKLTTGVSKELKTDLLRSMVFAQFSVEVF